jgi:hypothetical protein
MLRVDLLVEEINDDHYPFFIEGHDERTGMSFRGRMTLVSNPNTERFIFEDITPNGIQFSGFKSNQIKHALREQVTTYKKDQFRNNG